MLKPGLRGIPIRAAVAGFVFVIGVSWALYSVFRGGGNSTITVSTPEIEKHSVIVAPTPPAIQPSQPQHEAVSRIAESVKSKVARVPTSSPSTADAVSIALEAADTFDLAINPSVEKYLAYLERRGETDGYFAKLKDAERDTYLRSKSQSFAGQYLDLEKAQVRWRYIDGREIEAPKEIGGYATPKRTFDAVMNPSASGLTVMEVIIPVAAKTVVMGTKPCRLGLWIGKTREKPTWTTMRIYTYDVPGNAGVVSPPF